MREQDGDGTAGTSGGGRSRAAAAVGRLREELAQLGVGEATLDALARRLAPMIRGLSDEGYAAALAGVALAHSVHRDQEGALRRSLRELAEIQRLLGAFGEELCRLDEALRTLSREVQRGRVDSLPSATRRLH